MKPKSKTRMKSRISLMNVGLPRGRDRIGSKKLLLKGRKVLVMLVNNVKTNALYTDLHYYCWNHQRFFLLIIFFCWLAQKLICLGPAVSLKVLPQCGHLTIPCCFTSFDFYIIFLSSYDSFPFWFCFRIALKAKDSAFHFAISSFAFFCSCFFSTI